jgi:hypothetical protein
LRVICVRRSIHSVMVRCFLGFLVLICICSTIRMSCCCCSGLWLCGRSWLLGAWMREAVLTAVHRVGIAIGIS